MRPLAAFFDFSALRHNFQCLQNLAGTTRLWAVIKADAYGHGQFTAAQALAGLADGFALLEVDNALALRQAGCRAPLLLLEGFFSADEIPALAEHGITPAVGSAAQLQMLKAAEKRPKSVYLKINSGMNRLGFQPAEAAAARDALQEMGIADLTVMSHFARADEPGGIDAQMAALQPLKAWGLPMSLANSAALIDQPSTRQAWARPGIALYGASPFAGRSAAALGLRPVMTLDSALIGLQMLAPGDAVGYGGTFVAPCPMRIGIVACGYADGYPRHAPTGTPVAVGGQMSRTIGRVSMDMLAVDLTDLPEAAIGTPVTLWGDGAGGHVPVDDVAAAAGTIGYELLCALAPRVPRRGR
jgi:alanine racemase